MWYNDTVTQVVPISISWLCYCIIAARNVITGVNWVKGMQDFSAVSLQLPANL